MPRMLAICESLVSRNTKVCPKCKTEKSSSEFRPRKKKGGIGLQSWCRECEKLYTRQWQRERGPQPYSQTMYEQRIKRQFGLTPEQYQSLLTKQANVCAGCKRPSNRRLAVDHDHETGEVRGLLCHKCNYALGYVNDSPNLLRDLASYVENPPYKLIL